MNESDLIDDYLKERLTTEQTADFEVRMTNDITLKRQVAIRKLIIDSIHEGYTRELKEKLIQYDTKLGTKQKFSINWRIAASVAFLLLTSLLTYNIFLKPKPSDFDFYEPGLPITMNHSNQVQLNNAMSKFKMGDFQAAGIVFENLLSQKSTNDTLLYYSGLCDFRLKNTDMASDKFERIKPESEFYEKALYRLAITHWTNNRSIDAKVLLEEVIATTKDSTLKEEAKKALNAIP
ncbi:MAG: hypothetical protein KIT51_10100 [Cyclobacteriaceae bacterium]|nr:MAG: hypothetical protein KIT51_10100 [Cyclobacteriaceae bacterium]